MKETNLQVKITEDDIIVCDCGQDKFVVLDSFYKASSPIIGSPPIIGPLNDHLLLCLSCKKVYTFENAKTIKDSKKMEIL